MARLRLLIAYHDEGAPGDRTTLEVVPMGATTPRRHLATVIGFVRVPAETDLRHPELFAKGRDCNALALSKLIGWLESVAGELVEIHPDWVDDLPRAERQRYWHRLATEKEADRG